MTDYTEMVEQLLGVLEEVAEGRAELSVEKERLENSKEGAEQFEELLSRCNDVLSGVRKQNRAKKRDLEDTEREMRTRVQNTFNDLERARRGAKERRVSEDAAFEQLEGELRRTLGSDADRAAKEAARLAAEAFPEDEPTDTPPEQESD